MIRDELSHHILPNASTMLGVCLTGIGLVKIAEAHIEAGHVDEYLAVNSLFFLTSCMCSYLSIRQNDVRNRLEQLADVFFDCGLVVMTLISVTLAYELIQ